MAIDKDLVELRWGPLDINCAYDRSCNLSCPSCRTKRIIETNRSDEISEIQKKLESEAIPDARYLYITGSGDAFGSPFFNHWLRTMQIAENEKLHIHLHTNGLLWTPKMWRQIPEKVRARIKSAEISIDAASDETYKLNRRGGEFSELLTNLEFVAELHHGGPLEDLKFSMVVQANNFHEMPEFGALAKKYGADVVYFEKLAHWGVFTALEYPRRAIHLKGHPKHSNLEKALDDSRLRGSQVFLGNLEELRN